MSSPSGWSKVFSQSGHLVIRNYPTIVPASGTSTSGCVTAGRGNVGQRPGRGGFGVDRGERVGDVDSDEDGTVVKVGYLLVLFL